LELCYYPRCRYTWFARWEVPSGTILNQAVGGGGEGTSSNEIGTDRSADEK